MEVHKPKPAHSIREFLTEIGTIICGILIAIGLEQALEAAHWRHVVEHEDRALQQEVDHNYKTLLVRVIMQPCIDRRLAELSTVFQRHDRGDPLGLIGPIGRPTVFGGSKTTLQMAIADQSLSHMPLEQKNAIFATYGSFDIFTPIANEERAGWRMLQLLDNPNTLDTVDWRDLRRAYNDVVDNNTSMKANLKAERSGQWLTTFARFPKPDIATLTGQVNGLPYVEKLCRPAVRR
jgi:hypothetical protein